jgi:RimJ/RimL family protein N-acetyltransferase
VSGIELPAVSPVVQGDGVVLRPWDESDLPDVLEIADDQVARQWSGSLRQLRTLDDARAWMAERTAPGRIDWAVRDATTGVLVGRTGLFRFRDGPDTAELGYGVHQAHRRRGVAAAATTAVWRWGVEELGLFRVELRHAVDNLASCAVATRIGFAYEGTDRASLDHDDGHPPHDMHRHARLVTDPPPPAEPPPHRLVVPTLDGDGVRLRPWREDDVPELARGLRDPEVARWQGGGRPADTTEDDARRFLHRLRRRADEGSTVAWAVESGGRLAGAVGLRSINRVDLHASVAYWVLPERRRRGIATRALETASRHGFDGLGLHRLQLQHALANAASCGVAERAGFVLEATHRDSYRIQQGDRLVFVDEHQHVRLDDR